MEGIRTTPVEVGTIPYFWNVQSVYQCVWFVYGRCLEKSLSPPCWYDGSGTNGTGAYTNAKDWLNCYRSPWIPISKEENPNYIPVENDVVVYDFGDYGHVQFMETATMYSQYANGDPNSFRNGKLSEYSHKGDIIGYLHYPSEIVKPVARNTSVNQIQTTDITLRIRNKPSLQGEVMGYVQLGYYDVLDQKQNDNFTWYKLDKDRWCANESTIYLPSDDTDIIKEIERYFNSMKDKVNALSEENMNIRTDMDEIHKISERWQNG